MNMDEYLKQSEIQRSVDAKVTNMMRVANAQLVSAMREAELGIVLLDKMLLTDGYTDEAKACVAELRVLVQQVAELAAAEGGT